MEIKDYIIHLLGQSQTLAIKCDPKDDQNSSSWILELGTNIMELFRRPFYQIQTITHESLFYFVFPRMKLSHAKLIERGRVSILPIMWRCDDADDVGG